MALEQGLVVRTALRLLDEVGFEGLTLCKIATELNVQAPALYWLAAWLRAIKKRDYTIAIRKPLGAASGVMSTLRES
jgi:hypothetical protein